MIYDIDVTFCGAIGIEENYTIEDADSLDEAEELAIEEAANELDVVNVEEEEEGIYSVEVQFGGYSAVSEVYEIEADDEDEAREEALEAAKDDLSCELVAERED